MREVYAMNETQMGDWKQICATFAKKIDAELLFVNETSCGVQYKNGTFGHIYIDEMAEYLKALNEKEGQSEMKSIGKADVSIESLKKGVQALEGNR